MSWLRNRLIIHTNKADYLANQEITEWQKYQPKNSEEIKTIQWSEEKELPLQQRRVLTKKHRGPTLEQVILDTHSGRLFGMAGVYFADVIALLTIVLTLMGVYLWYRRIKGKSR